MKTIITCHKPYESHTERLVSLDQVLTVYSFLPHRKEEKDRLVVTGNTFMLLTKHYPDDKVHQPMPPFQRFAGDGLFPIIPNTKYMGSATSLKLHYSLPDGTSYV